VNSTLFDKAFPYIAAVMAAGCLGVLGYLTLPDARLHEEVRPARPMPTGWAPIEKPPAREVWRRKFTVDGCSVDLRANTYRTAPVTSSVHVFIGGGCLDLADAAAKVKAALLAP
jgi:hypothetical protein